MMDFVSWDDFPFPTVSGKSFKIPWFQSPPSSKTWGFNLIGKTWALDALVPMGTSLVPRKFSFVIHQQR